MLQKTHIIILSLLLLCQPAYAKEYSRDKILDFDILGLKLGMRATVANNYLLKNGYVLNNGNPPSKCDLEYCVSTSYTYNNGKNKLELFTAPSMKDEPVLISKIKYLPYLSIGKFINNKKVETNGFEDMVNDSLKNLKMNIVAKYGHPTLDSNKTKTNYLKNDAIFELYYIDEEIPTLLELHNFKTNLYSDLRDFGQNKCFVGQIRYKGLQNEHRKTYCNVKMHNNFDKVLTEAYSKLLNKPYLAIILFNYTNENPLLFELGFNDLIRHQTRSIKYSIKDKEKRKLKEELEKAVDFNIEF